MKILVIDTDNGRIRTLKSLDSQGHLVQGVDNWNEAGSLMEQTAFQILVLGPDATGPLSDWRQSLEDAVVPAVVVIDSDSGGAPGIDLCLPMPIDEKAVAALPNLPNLPPEPETIDLEAAKEICDGDEDLLREISSIFLKDGTRRIEMMTRGMADKNWGMVLEAAHLMKGSSLNLAAEPLRVATKNLERAGERRNPAQISFWFEQTLYEHKRLVHRLNGIIGNRAG